MRGAFAALLAALAAGCVIVTSSGAATARYASAQAAIAAVGDTSYGAVASRRGEDGSVNAPVETAEVTVRRGSATATTAPTGVTGAASVKAARVTLLGGRITAAAVRRSAERDEAGVTATGIVEDLMIDGTYYSDVRKPRTIRLGADSRLVLNTGTAGMHLITADGDVRVAVADVTTYSRTVPDPTPTPTTTVAPTPTPKRTPRATAEPTKTPRPKATPKAKRRKAPKAPARLTAGGYAFPVYGDVTYDSTFGATRAAPIVSHEGNDIFAPFGSPAVAVSDGRLTKVGTLPISGNRLWLVTDTGDAFFYAHLSSFSRLARNGARVQAGDVLGFVGNTGDAEPTPPHVHFEVHPGGIAKDAVDPYPILQAWEADQDVPPGAWLQKLGADATERPGALVTVRDFIAE